MQFKNQNKQFLSFLPGVLLVFLGGCAQFDSLLSTSDTPADTPSSRPAESAAIAVAGDAPFPALVITDTGADSAKVSIQAELLNEIPVDDVAETFTLSDEEVLAVGVDVAEAESDAKFGATDDDVWSRIRAGFELEEYDHRRIKREFAWFSRHPEYIDRVAKRARPYLHFIIEEVESRGIPTELALLPIVESAFQPFAYSHGRASGIWQFIPSTGKLYGLKQTWWYDGRRDVYASTRAALTLLQRLNKQFKGDWLLALAAYNSGAGTVSKAIRKNKKRGKPIDFFSLGLPRETRGYVPKLLALKKLIADPEAVGMTIAPIPNEPYFKRIDIGSQIDLALAADLAGIKIDELYQLNPAFNRWATDPKGPHYLLLPLGQVDEFETALNKLPKKDRVRWVRHKIRNGETLSTIATKYHTSVTLIKRTNRIRGTQIRAGKSLIIPVASRSAPTYKHSAEQRKSRTQNVSRKGKKTHHTVQRGDTLWDIAQLYKVGVRALAKWNSMAPTDTLRLGQKLVIWSNKSAKVSVIEAAHHALPPNRSITKRIGYRVRRGDSLSRISSKFNVSVAQLRRWNKLPKGKYLQPGQYLTVYVDVTSQTARS